MATANNIRDGGARYVATSFNISAERSLIQTTGRAEVWAATLLRLQLGSCPSGEDAIVVVAVISAIAEIDSFHYFSFFIFHGVLYFEAAWENDTKVITVRSRVKDTENKLLLLNPNYLLKYPI